MQKFFGGNCNLPRYTKSQIEKFANPDFDKNITQLTLQLRPVLTKPPKQWAKWNDSSCRVTSASLPQNKIKTKNCSCFDPLSAWNDSTLYKRYYLIFKMIPRQTLIFVRFSQYLYTRTTEKSFLSNNDIVPSFYKNYLKPWEKFFKALYMVKLVPLLKQRRCLTFSFQSFYRTFQLV